MCREWYVAMDHVFDCCCGVQIYQEMIEDGEVNPPEANNLYQDVSTISVCNLN